MKMVKFNIDGTLLISCSVDETIRVYENDGEFVGKFKTKSAVRAIDISVDSNIIISAETVEGFGVYSMKEKKEIARIRYLIPKEEKEIVQVVYTTFSVGSKYCAVLLEKCSRSYLAIVDMTNPSKPEIARILKAYKEDCYTQVTWGDLNEKIYLSTSTGIMMSINTKPIFDMPKYDSTKPIPTLESVEVGMLRKIMHIKSIFSFTLASDYSMLYTCGEDNKVVLSDPITLDKIKDFHFTVPARAVGIYPLYKKNPFSESLKYHIAVGGGIDAKDVALQKSEQGYFIRITNFVTNEEVLECPGHFGPIHSIAYSPNGKSFATASEDSTIRLWVQTEEYDNLE